MVERFETRFGRRDNSLTFPRKVILPARCEQALAQFTCMHNWLIEPTRTRLIFSTSLTEQYQYVLLVVLLLFLHRLDLGYGRRTSPVQIPERSKLHRRMYIGITVVHRCSSGIQPATVGLQRTFLSMKILNSSCTIRSVNLGSLALSGIGIAGALTSHRLFRDHCYG